ncbi:MAG: enoyl-CoA hydratase-related protein [bacterium]
MTEERKAMGYDTILLEKRDRLAIVTINRPDKLNALNFQAKVELKHLFDQLKIDPDVDVVILTGAGEKAFVAGTDIKELTELNAKTGTSFSHTGQAVFQLIEELGKPVIAAVNGFALGGGAELALACHIRIASENAKFGQPEVNLGIIPGYGGTQRLPRLVGRGKALEMILTGDPIDAQEALRIGLVNKVVPLTELMDTAITMGKKISAKGQMAIRLALQCIKAAEEMSLSEGLALESKLFGECCGSEDFKEGTTAFLEKRKPQFKNR